MRVDATDFFRQVTLHICGSLDITEALFNTYEYINQCIPVDEASYTHFVPSMGAIQFVACATREGGRDLGLTPMPLPSPLLRWLKQDINRKQYYLMNRPSDHPLSQAITEFRGMDPNTSILVVRLILKGEFLGSFNLARRGLDRYTNEQVELLATIKEPLAIALANCLQHQETLRLKALKEKDNRYLQGQLKQQMAETIVGMDFGLKAVMSQVRQVAGSNSPVLLLGETGTGKEIIARSIHKLSPRSEGPFVAVNCGAIHNALVDSELFGHEKGAFTGAISLHRGRFERAHGGTIFLDEIGELPMEAQVRLLRVLQEREVERIGSTETIKIDIRVIAATHRDLTSMVSQNEFRKDLLFRLNVFPITIPALKNRKIDIPALAQHFLQKKGHELGIKHTPTLTSSFIDGLMAYDWPGNVRELENFMERALIVNRGDIVTTHGLVSSSPVTQTVKESQDARGFPILDDVMRKHIQAAMDLCGGRIEGESGAAKLLGIKPNTLRARMKKLGITFGRGNLQYSK